MTHSIAGTLADLQKRVGDDTLQPVIAGVHHVAYDVRPGCGRGFASEIQSLTGYRIQGAWRDARSGDLHIRMRRLDDPIGLLIQECAADSPRMAALGFRVSSMDRVKEYLRKSGIDYEKNEAGLRTALLSGLDCHFQYVEAPGIDWFGGGDFEPEERILRELQAPTVPAASPIGAIDHVAFRIHGKDMIGGAELVIRLTGHDYTECFNVVQESAETIVFRRGKTKPAIVISYPYGRESVVWQYVERQGPRVHHTAFYTDNIRPAVAAQQDRGIGFTTPELIGGEDRGILQIFTQPSGFSFEITEYIERFQGFTGFFDEQSVGQLMTSTRQFS